jgi:hypothetical protein
MASEVVFLVENVVENVVASRLRTIAVRFRMESLPVLTLHVIPW